MLIQTSARSPSLPIYIWIEFVLLKNRSTSTEEKRTRERKPEVASELIIIVYSRKLQFFFFFFLHFSLARDCCIPCRWLQVKRYKQKSRARSSFSLNNFKVSLAVCHLIALNCRQIFNVYNFLWAFARTNERTFACESKSSWARYQVNRCRWCRCFRVIGFGHAQTYYRWAKTSSEATNENAPRFSLSLELDCNTISPLSRSKQTIVVCLTFV